PPPPPASPAPEEPRAAAPIPEPAAPAPACRRRWHSASHPPDRPAAAPPASRRWHPPPPPRPRRANRPAGPPLQPFDRRGPRGLAAGGQHDLFDPLLRLPQPAFAMGAQPGAAFVQRDGLFQRGVAVFQLADDGFELLHRILERHAVDFGVGHAAIPPSVVTCARTERPSAGRS